MNIMNPLTTYVPVLKAKKGELTALKELSDEHSQSIVPLFEIPKVKWDFVDSQAGETTRQLIDRVLGYIQDYWSDKPFFIDVYGEPMLNVEEPELNVAEVLADSIEGSTLRPIFVSSFDYPADYQQSLRERLISEESGCALRVTFDPDDIHSKDDYENWIRTFNIELNKVDLILDLGSVAGDSPETVYYALRLLLAEAPYISAWRSVIVTASSFPKSMGAAVSINKERTLDRSEWLGWKKLYELGKKLERLPVYGDYSIAHPEIFDDIDPRYMPLYGGIRYTLEDQWLLIRGDDLRKKGFGQFHDLADKLKISDFYHGEDFSWGDNYISQCANPETSTGNLATWRSVGNNQHFVVITQQLATLSERS